MSKYEKHVQCTCIRLSDLMLDSFESLQMGDQISIHIENDLLHWLIRIIIFRSLVCDINLKTEQEKSLQF